MLGGAGCSSDPNVEGAKLDLRNKDYDKALQNVETALSKNPDNAEALDLKGRILQEQANATTDPAEHARFIDEMLAAYNRAAELNPELKEEIDQRLRLAYYNEFQRGIQAFNKGREEASEYNNAAAYFEAASRIQPDSSGAYTNAAFALINAGRSQDAIVPFEKAIQAGEQQPDSYIYLADLYIAGNRAPEAVTLLETARQRFESNPQILDQLLNAYVKAGQMDRALNVFGEAVRNEPNNKLYRYNYGSLLLNAERYDEAIENLRAATQVDPDYADAWYNLGASYINKAVDVNEDINALDDSLRANRASLSDAQARNIETKMEQLSSDRKGLFSQAIDPLESARRLRQTAGEDQTQICQALFTAYVQTGQQDKAQSVSQCAGY